MEDSFKGMLISFGLISVFILALTNFIILFPIEQGFSFTEIDNVTFVSLNDTTSTTTILNLSSMENTINTGYSEWDIEIGYMGSNTQKSSKSSLTNYFTNVISTLKVIANEVFSTSDGVHPVLILISFLSSIGLIYGTIVFVKWLRTGY